MTNCGKLVYIEKQTQIFQSIDSLGPWFSNSGIHENYLEGLLKHKLLGPIPRVFDTVDLGED